MSYCTSGNIVAEGLIVASHFDYINVSRVVAWSYRVSIDRVYDMCIDVDIYGICSDPL